MLKPELVTKSWEYFKNEQGMKQQYVPMVSKEDKPATYFNTEIMETYRERLKPFYYDETKYNSYLEQLGIQYPTVKQK